jgi:Skp family chaperone for outer membrane proteins
MKTLIPVLLAAAAAPAALGQAAARGEAKQPKIAVIDMARVSAESLMGKGYAARLEQMRAEIEAEQKKKQSDLEKLDTAVKALQDELEKQQSVLSPEALDKKRQDIVKKGRERQAFLEDGQAELQRMRERAQQQAQVLNNEFQIKIKPHIEAVAKEKGIDILIDSQVTLTTTKDFDISQDVIIKADDAERAARPAAGAAARPATPAPTPAPSAAPAPPPAPTPSPTPSPSGRP